MTSMKNGKRLAMGMSITRKRLELLGKKYNLVTGLEINEVHPGESMPGTRVEIIVPFASAAEQKDRESIE
jgi:hypothetical protein